MGPQVVAVDIASIKSPSKFAWAAFGVPGRDPIAEGKDPNSATKCLAAGLVDNRQAVLLLESPMSVPDPCRTGTTPAGARWKGSGTGRGRQERAQACSPPAWLRRLGC